MDLISKALVGMVLLHIVSHFSNAEIIPGKMKNCIAFRKQIHAKIFSV